MRENPRASWSPKDQNNDQNGFAVSRVYIPLSDIKAPSTFSFRKGDRFFCVGSCFAREIEDAISSTGGVASTSQLAEKLISEHPVLFERRAGILGRNRAFLNRYNVPSMALLIDDVINDSLGSNLLFGSDRSLGDLHYTRFLCGLDHEASLKRRRLLREMYLRAIEQSNIFVFTLGLCEAFFDRSSGAAMNIAPTAREVDGANIEFRFVDVEENVDALRSIVTTLRAIRPDASVIVTVSPVPLDVTFTGHDIVVANTLAKSILVAAAHIFCSTTDDCFYFPSFEIATLSTHANAWLWDKKHVSPDIVNHIIKTFMDRHIVE
jgi:hypothetical protein